MLRKPKHYNNKLSLGGVNLFFEVAFLSSLLVDSTMEAKQLTINTLICSEITTCNSILEIICYPLYRVLANAHKQTNEYNKKYLDNNILHNSESQQGSSRAIKLLA